MLVFEPSTLTIDIVVCGMVSPVAVATDRLGGREVI
jgi:hypothetical protein